MIEREGFQMIASTSSTTGVATTSDVYSSSGGVKTLAIATLWSVAWNLNNNPPVRQVTYGGAPMVSAGVIVFNNASMATATVSFVEQFVLFSPASGSQVVELTVSKEGGNLAIIVAGSIATYRGVDSYNVSTNFGQGQDITASQVVSSAVGHKIHQTFARGNATVLTGYNQTELGAVAAANLYGLSGEASGASSVNFSVTMPSGAAGTPWASMALDMTPLPPNSSSFLQFF